MGKKSRAKRERRPRRFYTEAELRYGVYFTKIEKDENDKISSKRIPYSEVMKDDYEVKTRIHKGPDG